MHFRRGLAFGLLLACVSGASALATPRYAARYNQDCNLCHVSPTGGGMRTAYAAQFLIPMEMAMKPTPESTLENLDPQISQAISIGVDLRTFYMYSEDKAYRDGFFEMQGDFYTRIEVDPRFTIYLDQGMTQTRELYGMGYVLPANGYVRVGRFIPAFGWISDDHTLFVREMLGFTPPAHTDTGIEFGLHPGNAVLNLGVMNGAGGLSQDNDHRLAGFLRSAIRQRVFDASLTLGGSFAYSESDAGPRRMGGPFGSASIGPFTWVGEMDWLRAPVEGVEGGTPDALVTSHELFFQLRRGLSLRATYDFYDPDVDTESGALSAYGVGVDALIYPFLGVQAMAVKRETDDGPGISGLAEEYFQPRIQVHFLF